MVSVENNDDKRRVLVVISSQGPWPSPLFLARNWTSLLWPQLLSWFKQEILAKAKYPNAKIFTVQSSTGMLTTLSGTVIYSVASSIWKKARAFNDGNSDLSTPSTQSKLTKWTGRGENEKRVLARAFISLIVSSKIWMTAAEKKTHLFDQFWQIEK